MADKVIRYDGKSVALIMNEEVLKRVTGHDNSTDLSQEKINEIGNADIVESKDNNPNVSLSFNGNEVGSMAMLLLLGSGDKLSTNSADYDAKGVFKGIYSTKTKIRMKAPNYDLDNNKRPEILVKVSEKYNTNVSRTCHIASCFVSAINGSYDVNGLASENVTIESDNKTWYQNDFKNCHTTVLTPTAGTLTATSTVTKTASLTLVKVCVNRVWYDSTVASWSGTTVTFSGIPNLDGTERTVMLYAEGDKTATNDFPELTPVNTGTKGGLRRGAIEIYCRPSDGTDTLLLRAQSVNYSCPLSRTPENQLGTQDDLDRSIGYPLVISTDLSFKDSDLENWAILQGKQASFADKTLKEMKVSDFLGNLVVTIKIYSDERNHDASKLVKTITIENLKPKSEANNFQQGNNAATWNVSMEGSAITWESTGNAIA